jgi:hypothetical protein
LACSYVAALTEFLSFVATHDIADPTMDCHEIQRNKSQTVADESHKKIINVLLHTVASPRGTKLEYANAGIVVARTKDLWEGRKPKLDY